MRQSGGAAVGFCIRANKSYHNTDQKDDYGFGYARILEHRLRTKSTFVCCIDYPAIDEISFTYSVTLGKRCKEFAA
jgi:hypothetical protein